MDAIKEGMLASANAAKEVVKACKNSLLGKRQREIKFRAIDLGGHWVYGDLIHKRTSLGDVMIRCKNGIEADVDITTIGQFTGLYDKDGEELYEGDIIRSFDSDGNSILHHIEYRGASFVAILKDSFPLYGNIMTQDWLKEFKKTIIGNIYDNKEYLEE